MTRTRWPIFSSFWLFGEIVPELSTGRVLDLSIAGHALISPVLMLVKYKSRTPNIMTRTPKSKTFVEQKKMGRPVTVEAERSIGIRLPGQQLEAVDTWAEAQGITSRSEAIRRLIDYGLSLLIDATDEGTFSLEVQDPKEREEERQRWRKETIKRMRTGKAPRKRKAK
jgi:Arc/MetJ-type ribon-helix-helix transcriptional regulator